MKNKHQCSLGSICMIHNGFRLTPKVLVSACRFSLQGGGIIGVSKCMNLCGVTH